MTSSSAEANRRSGRTLAIAIATSHYPLESTIVNTISGLSPRISPVIFYEKEKRSRFDGKDGGANFPSFRFGGGHFKPSFLHDLFSKRGLCPACIGQLRHMGIRLIHAQFASTGMNYMAVAEKLAVPLICHCRGQDVFELPRKYLYRRALSRLFKKAQLFLTTSDHMRKHMVADLGCPDELVFTFYTGVDLERFRFNPDIPRRAGFSVLMCGRLVDKKGFDDGLKIFKAVSIAHPETSLTIAGKGPKENELRRAAEDLGITGRVRFIGHLSQKEVAAQMDASSALLMPYRITATGDSEGLPNILKEALAKGLPIVSTRHAGVEEAVSDGVNGLLRDEGDLRGLSQALSELAGNMDLRVKLSSNGRATAERLFDRAKQAIKLEDMYQNSIDKFSARHYDS